MCGGVFFMCGGVLIVCGGVLIVFKKSTTRRQGDGNASRFQTRLERDQGSRVLEPKSGASVSKMCRKNAEFNWRCFSWDKVPVFFSVAKLNTNGGQTVQAARRHVFV